MISEDQTVESTTESLSENVGDGSSEETTDYMNKYISIIRAKDAGFTSDEKIAFADLIIKSFLKQDINVNCYECKTYYKPNAMPYQLKCGHSSCFVCYSKAKRDFCSSCSQNMEIRSPVPNLDLLSFAVTIQNALTVVCKSREKPGLKPAVPRESLMLTGMASLFDKAEYGIYVTQNMQDVMRDRINKINNATEMLTQVATLVTAIRNKTPDLSQLAKLCRRISMLIKLSENLKEIEKMLQKILFTCLEETTISEQDFYQLLTQDIYFNMETLKSLKDSGYHCWAVADLNGKCIYSKLSIGPGVVAHVFQEFPRDVDLENIYIIEYETLRYDCFAAGVFLELLFDEDPTQEKRQLYLNIDAAFLFIRQLCILCSGEKGASYKGGRGFVSGECVTFETYANGEHQRSDDYILGVPDVVGKSEVPEAEMVYADRLFEKEAQFYITKKNLKGKRQCVGKVRWGKIGLLPEGKFTISNCGVLFTSIDPTEPSVPPQEPSEPPKEQIPPQKSEELAKEQV